MDYVICSPENMLCSPLYCNVSKPNRHIQLINIGCELSEPQDKIHVRVQLFRRYNRFQPFLLDAVMDACKYMGGSRGNQLLAEFVIPKVVSCSNFNFPCPYNGKLWIRNFTLDFQFAENMQAPEGQYRMDLTVFNSVTNGTLMLFRGYFKIITKYAARHAKLGN